MKWNRILSFNKKEASVHTDASRYIGFKIA